MNKKEKKIEFVTWIVVLYIVAQIYAIYIAFTEGIKLAMIFSVVIYVAIILATAVFLITQRK
jgi:hypothetical protein